MLLSREQSSLVKGIAILLIMTHNFVDELLGIYCNEMAFSEKIADTFLSHVFTADWLWYILAYAGWAGVPLFFFLSGYGLTKKYDIKKPFNTGSFIKNHVMKLWLLLVPVYVVFFLLYRNNFQSFFAQITFTINFLDYGKNAFRIDPGPYWFFGAILQFYLLFIAFRRLSNRWLWVICFGFLITQYFMLYQVSAHTMTWMRHNFLGWGVPFVLGMIAARSQFNHPKRVDVLLCLASFVGFFACITVKCVAPLAEVFIVILLVTIGRLVSAKWLGFIGVISPSVFVVHPLVRMLFYSLVFKPEYPYILTFAYLCIALLASWVHHIIFKKAYQYIPLKQN